MFLAYSGVKTQKKRVIYYLKLIDQSKYDGILAYLGVKIPKKPIFVFLETQPYDTPICIIHA